MARFKNTYGLNQSNLPLPPLNPLPQMPYKTDKPHLTIERKAKVLAEKNSGIFTVKMIAEENNITERTVYNIAKTDDPEIIELAAEFKKTLIKQAKRNVNVGLDIMHERMHDSSSKLSEITGAVKISHDIYRLETDQSTQNVATRSDSPESICDKVVAAMLTAKLQDGSLPTIAHVLAVFREVPDDHVLVKGTTRDQRLEYIERKAKEHGIE